MAVIDIEKQLADPERMSDELQRLNAEFDRQKTALGVTDDDLKIDPDTLSEPLKAAMAEAKAKAEEAGRQAAAAARTEAAPSGGARRARRGSIAI